MCKKYWHRISEIIYCIDDYVLYVKTSVNSLHYILYVKTSVNSLHYVLYVKTSVNSLHYVLYVKTSVNSLHYVLYVKTSVNSTLCSVCQNFSKHSTLYACKIYIFFNISKYGYYIGTNVIPHCSWTLYQMPTNKTNLTCTRYIHNRCTKSSCCVFWHSMCAILETVYNFCLLGNYYLNIVCTVQVVEVSL
jgi:hypothetical protein